MSKYIFRLVNGCDLYRIFSLMFFSFFISIASFVDFYTRGFLLSLCMFFLSLFVFLFVFYFVRFHEKFSGFSEVLRREVFSEFFISSLFLLVLLFNLIVSISSYYVGGNLFGCFLLFSSLGVFSFRRWGGRFFYLFLVLIVGVSFIELYSDEVKVKRELPGFLLGVDWSSKLKVAARLLVLKIFP